MKRPLNIGFVGNVPQPFGGVATFCYHLISKLLAKDHHVSLYDTVAHSHKNYPSGLTQYTVTPKGMSVSSICLFVSVLTRALFDRKLRIFVSSLLASLYYVGLPQVSIKMAVLVVLRAFDMWRFFKDKEVDIFHGQHAGCEAFAMLMLAKYYFKCPCLITVHASEFTMMQNRRFLFLAKYVCENSNGVMAVSQYTHRQMKETGVNPQVSSVIYHGVDPVHFSSSKQVPDSLKNLLTFEEGIPVVLYVGWLIERKGPQILLKSLSQLAHLPWRAVFVGPDHGLKFSLQQRAEELSLCNRISIISDVSNEELLAIYSAADVFVFPTLSKDEGFGLVAVEAMAHGLPVIASRTGAIPETVIDGETGLFFDPGDFVGLAKQLECLLGDAALRSKMGTTASQWVKENFSWDKSAGQVISLYESVIREYDNAQLAIHSRDFS